jgi:hypothetical protein
MDEEYYYDSGFGDGSYGGDFGISEFLPDSSGAGFDFASFFPDTSSQDIADQAEAIDYSGYADLTGPQLAELAASQDPNVGNILRAAMSAFGDKAGAFAKKFLFDPKTGNLNLAGIGTAAAALYSLNKDKDSGGGYQKPVPKMEMVREQVQYTDPNRRPGEGGRQYFTDPRFVIQGADPEANAAAMTAAKDASAAQATGLQAAYQARPVVAPNPYAGKIPTAFNPKAAVVDPNATLPSIADRLDSPSGNDFTGGIGMAKGGIASAGRYLQGKTDGMADKIPSNIDGKQEAALSHGEFVIPADVVSHLGNGNSEAGAQKLYQMMDRIRQARTGTKEQGKQINPDKFLPAASGGLMTAYAAGGEVQKFQAGGVPLDVSKANTLSPYVGDYVTGALGQGAALANAPYQAYQGPLTAGASDLQQQAFAGASDLASAGYTPGSFTGGFGAQQATQYMNPYLQASLNPQLKELQRQSDIQRVADAGRLTKAGAFGGSRQAIMESEGRRNLLDKQQDVIGQGYKTAYDTGLGQFNKERESDEASRQFSANFGLKSVGQLADMGETQRGITSEGLAADRGQFEEQRDFAYKMPGYQLGLLQGLPIGTQTTATNQDDLSKIQSQISGLGSLYKTLSNLGVTPK